MCYDCDNIENKIFYFMKQRHCDLQLLVRYTF